MPSFCHQHWVEGGEWEQRRQLVYFYKPDLQAAISAQASLLQGEPLAWGGLQGGQQALHPADWPLSAHPIQTPVKRMWKGCDVFARGL